MITTVDDGNSERNGDNEEWMLKIHDMRKTVDGEDSGRRGQWLLRTV